MRKKFYDEYNGRQAFIYVLENGKLRAEILDLGANIHSLTVDGTDIVLGFNSVASYLASGTYAGATVGRVANRIAGGAFTLNGKAYFLGKNDGENHSHGGFSGFDKKFFNVTAYRRNSVTMQYFSPDGEENYPAGLNLTVTFTLSADALEITYSALADGDTLWSPTCHAYFNLDGEDSGDCRGNLLQINADYYTPLSKNRVPSGEKKSVFGTPFNFNEKKQIGDGFGKEELRETCGYDHNFVLNGGHAARAESAKTGIAMDLFTDLPCLQFYTGGMINGAAGKTRKYEKWAGFCLEPQFCPNAINLQGFETPVLKNGEQKTHFIRFKFTQNLNAN